ncbi:hypothetical protein [Ramlibacter rhizophilus]|uniref:hypothetical protein n=1 Tax=Ramlibacter rhizophilus TaxID=1781167 RepID=UPI001432395A|nr:hypothetical protein [Ramlibacter rhizophilus]
MTALASVAPAVVLSPWWLAGTAVLGLVSAVMRPIERRHHAQAMDDWARSCVCADCGASWQVEDLLPQRTRSAAAEARNSAFGPSLAN